jgi:hypothetical protein
VAPPATSNAVSSAFQDILISRSTGSRKIALGMTVGFGG